MARIKNDEGGPVRLVGQGQWSTLDIGMEYTNPVVVLLDQGGVFAAREQAFAASDTGQIFGQLRSNFRRPPFQYEIELPATPQGRFYDVDQDGDRDQGVQIWTVEVLNNFLTFPKEPQVLPLEQPLSMTPVSSVVTRPPRREDGIRRLVNGQLVVYAPDDQQGFPAGFGPDGELFTTDDPIVRLPQGYTVVTLASEGFQFERSRQATINLRERPARQKSDFSNLGYVAAFNALIDELKTRYAYTELRQIDWEAKRQKYLPQVEAAAQNQDAQAFLLVLSEFSRSLQDGHVRVIPQVVSPDIRQRFAGGLGLGVVETSDGRVLVNQVLPQSPAAQAGILPLAEIVAVNGQPMPQRITALLADSDEATPTNRRLQAVARSVRFPLNETVTLRYRQPGSPVQTVALTTKQLPTPQGATLSQFLQAAQYDTVRSLKNRTYGYIRWSEFLTYAVDPEEFGRFIQQARQQDLPGLILDLRYNGGGSSGLTLILLSYFWSQANPLRVDQTFSQAYDPQVGQFLTFPFFEVPPKFPIYAPTPNHHYPGPVVILVGENCASACEFFVDVMQRYNRATVIGARPTMGLGGAIQDVALPENLEFLYTYTRELDLEGRPYIEARGIEPDIRIPITETYLRAELQGRDPLLNAAMDYLDRR